MQAVSAAVKPTTLLCSGPAEADEDHCGHGNAGDLLSTCDIHDCKAEVNISPKISISAQPLKMALHRNPAMHGSRMVIFLHDSKKALF